MLQVFEKMGDDFLRAVASDIKALATNEQAYRDASFLASRALGIDVTGGLVKPYWDDAYNRGVASLKELVDAAAVYPDATAELIREKSASFADSFAEALKKRNELKKTEETHV